MKAIITGVMALGVFVRANGMPLDSSSAARAIIGEAGSESFQTQIAVAAAIRNRGSLQGVYGMNNPVVNKASAKLKAQAVRAWAVSATNDVTHGLKYFGCKADSGYFKSIGLHPAMQFGAITFWK